MADKTVELLSTVMPHVLRNAHGEIVSLHREPVAGSEHVPAHDPAVQAFLGAEGEGFASLDAGFIRVLEDVVDVLVARNLIRVTDLPADAQHKLYARKGFRDRARTNALRLFSDAMGDAIGLPLADPPAAGGGESTVFKPPRDTL